MIHRATLVPLSFLGLEDLCEQWHPPAGTCGAETVQLSLHKKMAPTNAVPSGYSRTTFLPPVPLKHRYLCHLAGLLGPSGRPNEIAFPRPPVMVPAHWGHI